MLKLYEANQIYHSIVDIYTSPIGPVERGEATADICNYRHHDHLLVLDLSNGDVALILSGNIFVHDVHWTANVMNQRFLLYGDNFSRVAGQEWCCYSRFGEHD